MAVDLLATLEAYLNAQPGDAPAGTWSACPMAIALRPLYGPRVWVKPGRTSLDTTEDVWLTNPRTLRRFIRLIDRAIREASVDRLVGWNRVTIAHARALLRQARLDTQTFAAEGVPSHGGV